MTGRGIDQILEHPGDPALHEPYVRDARDYVSIAERVNGPVARRVSASYVWGAGLDVLARQTPDVRIINLETSLTRADRPWPGKGIHYRMHPQNIACLTAAGVDVCVLANNHVLDYGTAGLIETLDTLRHVKIRPAGAGLTTLEAEAPAIVHLPGDRRVIVFGVGSETSGIPGSWAARTTRPGVWLLPDLSARSADALLDRVARLKRRGDVVIISLHWGTNWGYDVPDEIVAFAHRLLDGDVDLVHGHSSHHPRPIEIHRGKLALYGCGDLIHDYEGISGYEEYRNDLVLMYFPTLDPTTGRLVSLRMTPMRVRRLQLTRADAAEAEWLYGSLAAASAPFGTRLSLSGDLEIVLERGDPDA